VAKFLDALKNKIQEIRESILKNNPKYFSNVQNAHEVKDSAFLILIGLNELGIPLSNEFAVDMFTHIDFNSFFDEIKDCYLETGSTVLTVNNYVEYILSFLIVEGLIAAPNHVVPIYYE